VTLDLSAPGGDIRSFGTNAGILSTLATGTQSDPGSPTLGMMSGTSQAAPHVSGTAALMLAANPSLTIAQIRDILRGTAKSFAAGTVCERTGSLCGFGLLDAGAAVALARDLVGFKWNFQDHWYYPDENGWGIQVTAQGDVLFVTWYTYGPDGLPRWLTAQLTREGQDIFGGDIYATTGVPLSQINGSQAMKSIAKVGTATLFFYGFDEGAFIYEMGSLSGVKPIERLVISSPVTLCKYSTSSARPTQTIRTCGGIPRRRGGASTLPIRAM
jgi:hypothetical protein